jgi:hypothetical protein
MNVEIMQWDLVLVRVRPTRNPISWTHRFREWHPTDARKNRRDHKLPATGNSETVTAILGTNKLLSELYPESS